MLCIGGKDLDESLNEQLKLGLNLGDFRARSVVSYLKQQLCFVSPAFSEDLAANMN